MPMGNVVLSKRNASGGLESALNQDVEGAGKGLAFALDYGWLFL